LTVTDRKSGRQAPNRALQAIYACSAKLRHYQ
jgi:hypothetical protein